MNYYERHIGDYLKDTAHLSLLEHGIYGRLLDIYYSRESPIPAGMVLRLVGANAAAEKKALHRVLQEFFVLEADAWTQSRCQEEIARYQEKQRKAKASADARWSQSARNANASPNAMRTHSEGNALQSQTPDTTTKAKPSTGEGAPRATKRCPSSFVVTPELQAEMAGECPGIDLEAETRAFRDHTFDTARADWPATWRNWIRRARPQRQGAPTNRQLAVEAENRRVLAEVLGDPA